jgi:hypothetical protein
MTRDQDSPFSLEPDEINKLQLEQLKASYSVVVDDDILFAATLLVSVSNLATLKSERISTSGKKGPVRSCTLAPKTLDWKDGEDLAKPFKKRRSTQHVSKVSEFDRICAYCKCTETPMWRHGPPGFQNLCNKVI